MKKGLVMEGGAMKGIFTCGVIDVLMENGIEFDGAIGVSAGACFGCNYKSKQPGRAIRYNKRFVKDDRYASVKNFLREGNFYSVDFCYHKIPFELDLWDSKTFLENPMEFYAVATDCETGKAVYHKCKDGLGDDLQWIRASASVPLVSKVVEIGERKLLDGGLSDPIPLKYFQYKGYDKNVVITTKPIEYRDYQNHFLLNMMRVILHRFPNLIHTQEKRFIYYNKTVEYIIEQEKAGKIFVFRPPVPLEIGGRGKDEADLERVYQIGRREAEARLEELKAYLAD